MNEADAPKHQSKCSDNANVGPTPDWFIDIDGLSADVAQGLGISLHNLNDGSNSSGLSGAFTDMCQQVDSGALESTQSVRNQSVQDEVDQFHQANFIANANDVVSPSSLTQKMVVTDFTLSQPRQNQDEGADNATLHHLQLENESLRVHNEQLLGWIAELEQALNDSQESQAVLWVQHGQFDRSENQNISAVQPGNAQTAVRDYRPDSAGMDVSGDLPIAIVSNAESEHAQQTFQRQQILIETLTVQLESSQERVVEMEQEQALIQKRFAEQTQRLVETENECRELKTRLSRQQRYTLQFKAALEKCLDISVPGEPVNLNANLQSFATEVPITPISVTDDRSDNVSGNFLPRSQPVQPWSSENYSDNSLESIEQWAKRPEWEKVTQLLSDPIDALPTTSTPPQDAVALGIEPFAVQSQALQTQAEAESLPNAFPDSTLNAQKPELHVKTATVQNEGEELPPVSALLDVGGAEVASTRQFIPDERVLDVEHKGVLDRDADSLDRELEEKLEAVFETSESSNVADMQANLLGNVSVNLPVLLSSQTQVDLGLQHTWAQQSEQEQAVTVASAQGSAPRAISYQLWQDLAIPDVSEQSVSPPVHSASESTGLDPSHQAMADQAMADQAMADQAASLEVNRELRHAPQGSAHLHLDLTNVREHSECADLPEHLKLNSEQSSEQSSGPVQPLKVPTATSGPDSGQESAQEGGQEGGQETSTAPSFNRNIPPFKGSLNTPKEVAEIQKTEWVAPSLPIQSNWPSPLVYPLRPTKKRASLAAIELPTFPKKHPLV